MRSPERIDADRQPLAADEPFPAQGHAGLYGDLQRVGRQQIGTIACILLREKLKTGGRHDIGADSVGFERLCDVESQLHFRTGGDQHDLARAVRAFEAIGAPGGLELRVEADGRQVLA